MSIDGLLMVIFLLVTPNSKPASPAAGRKPPATDNRRTGSPQPIRPKGGSPTPAPRHEAATKPDTLPVHQPEPPTGKLLDIPDVRNTIFVLLFTNITIEMCI